MLGGLGLKDVLSLKFNLIFLFILVSRQKSQHTHIVYENGKKSYHIVLQVRSLANPNDTEWIPVELELVDRIWLPDTEILRLKGFHSLSVLDRLQVS